MAQCKIPLAFYANKISSFCLIISCRSLANREPGKINQACWLTTANRLFCLCVSTLNPSEDFLEIVNFVVYRLRPNVVFLLNAITPLFMVAYTCMHFYAKAEN